MILKLVDAGKTKVYQLDIFFQPDGITPAPVGMDALGDALDYVPNFSVN